MVDWDFKPIFNQSKFIYINIVDPFWKLGYNIQLFCRKMVQQGMSILFCTNALFIHEISSGNQVHNFDQNLRVNDLFACGTMDEDETCLNYGN